jgi:FkbM family methyltransferase
MSNLIDISTSKCVEEFLKIKNKYGSLDVVIIGTSSNPSPLEIYDNDHAKFFSIFDKNDTIYGIEPFTPAYLKCKNYFKEYYPNLNIQLFNYAIGDVDGEVNLYQGNSDWNNLKSGIHGTLITPDKHIGEYSWNNFIKVNSITFETFITTTNILKIDVLVIDTEGYDYEIIKKCLSSNIIPKIIFFEYNNFKENIRDEYIKFIHEHNYDVYKYDNNFMCILKMEN